MPIQTTPRALPGGGSGTSTIRLPGVAPMQNAAPGQMIETGRAVSAAGAVMGNYGQMLQDRIDDASVKRADTGFMQGVQELLQSPETGYFNSRGLDAKNRYGETMKAIEESAKKYESGLENDMQRQMFRANIDRHLPVLQGQVYGHASKETQTYLDAESQKRQDQYGSMAIRAYGTPQYEEYLGTAIGEAKSRAKSGGIPEDSEQYRDMIRGITSAVHGGVIMDMVAKDDYIGAGKVLEKARENDEITLKDYQRLRGTVTSGAARQSGIQFGEAVFAGQQTGGVGADFDSAYSVVWGFEVPKGTDGYVANDGGAGLTRFGINQAANPDVDVAKLTASGAKEVYRKKYWTGAGVDKLPEHVRLVYFDTAVNMGPGTAKQLYAESGGDPQKMIDLRRNRYAALAKKHPERYDENVVRSWARRLKTLEGTIGADGTTLTGMLKQADGIENQQERDAAKTTIREKYSEQNAAKKADHDALLERAQSVAYSKLGGWRNVSPDDWSKLTAKEQAELKTPPKADDPDVVFEIEDNPDKWSKSYLLSRRPYLSEGTFLKYWNKINRPGEHEQASYDKEIFQSVLIDAGMKDFLTAKKSDKKWDELVNLQASYKRAISNAQQAKGKDLSRDEQEQLLKRLLHPIKINTVYKSAGFDSGWWRSKGDKTTTIGRYYQVHRIENAAVPDKAREEIINKMVNSGIDKSKITNEMILRTYLNSEEYL